jgi:8-oxo-dGTP diphosphatase
VLLVRSSRRGESPGRWSLPGDRVRHGEHPRQSATRGVLAVTAQEVRVGRVRDALSDVRRIPRRREYRHTVHLVFETELSQGERPGSRSRKGLGLRLLEGCAGASGRRCVRVVPLEELPHLRLSGCTARALGLDPDDLPSGHGPAAAVEPVRTVPADAQHPGKSLPRVQRVGSYGVILSEGCLLMSRFAGNGRWSLPGGGVEHGEDPLDALHREILEETGLAPGGVRLRDVDSAHFTGQSPSGRVEDYHVVRILYSAQIPGRPRPHVTEIGGTTDDAAWVDLTEIGERPLSRAVEQALCQLGVRNT